jgi:hypothetical protein
MYRFGRAPDVYLKDISVRIWIKGEELFLITAWNKCVKVQIQDNSLVYLTRYGHYKKYPTVYEKEIIDAIIENQIFAD